MKIAILMGEWALKLMVALLFLVVACIVLPFGLIDLAWSKLSRVRRRR